MKKQKKYLTSTGSRDKLRAAEDRVKKEDCTKKVDRPGFDLGGASDDTHAGTGLGLGDDAFENAGDRRLPGRRLHNKLTIPRWSGPASDVKTSSSKTPSGRADHKK